MTYTCYLCKKTFDNEGELPELDNNQVLLCADCGDIVHRLTGETEELEVGE